MARSAARHGPEQPRTRPRCGGATPWLRAARAALGFAAAIAGSSCATPAPPGPPPDPAQQALDAHRRLWERQDIRSYRFVLDTSCFCTPEGLRSGRVTVRDGQVESVLGPYSREPLSGPRFTAIPGLFAQIQSAIDQRRRERPRPNGNPPSATVRYDDALGYPLEIHLQPSLEFPDSAVTYTIRRFERLPDE